jgi:hypothetical protein
LWAGLGLVVWKQKINKKQKSLLCSCFIPVFSGWVPLKYRGVMYIDGGVSDNCPRLDENTVMVCPFEGNFDVCPRDEAFKAFAVIA